MTTGCVSPGDLATTKAAATLTRKHSHAGQHEREDITANPGQQEGPHRRDRRQGPAPTQHRGTMQHPVARGPAHRPSTSTAPAPAHRPRKTSSTEYADGSRWPGFAAISTRRAAPPACDQSAGCTCPEGAWGRGARGHPPRSQAGRRALNCRTSRKLAGADGQERSATSGPPAQQQTSRDVWRRRAGADVKRNDPPPQANPRNLAWPGSAPWAGSRRRARFTTTTTTHRRPTGDPPATHQRPTAANSCLHPWIPMALEVAGAAFPFFQKNKNKKNNDQRFTSACCSKHKKYEVSSQFAHEAPNFRPERFSRNDFYKRHAQLHQMS